LASAECDVLNGAPSPEFHVLAVDVVVAPDRKPIRLSSGTPSGA